MGIRLLGLATIGAILIACSAPTPTATPTPTPSGARPVASCDAQSWPQTVVSCEQAQHSASLPAGSGGETLIWLTTLSAVDAAFSPPRQTADTPVDTSTPVWVFIYGANPGADRLLHVTDATSTRTLDGSFIYLYHWSELGSPALPDRMPTIGAAVASS